MIKTGERRKTNWVQRKLRVRKKIKGTTERPRLNVYRSARYVYAQIIDDTQHRTIVAASSRLKGEGFEKLNKTEAAKKVGEIIGRLAVEKGIKKVVFDRSGYLYHGRVKALAEGAREAGLVF
jgi:large subunit ribosomal protein L18